jgi:hypothetical protein
VIKTILNQYRTANICPLKNTETKKNSNKRIQTQNLKIINTIGAGADAYPSRVSNVLPVIIGFVLLNLEFAM